MKFTLLLLIHNHYMAKPEVFYLHLYLFYEISFLIHYHRPSLSFLYHRILRSLPVAHLLLLDIAYLALLGTIRYYLFYLVYLF